MPQYTVDVRPILAQAGESLSISDSLDIGVLRVGEETFAPTGPATFSVTLSNAGEQIVAFGTVEAPVAATCVRCLRQFPLTITGDVEDTFLQHGDLAPDDEDASEVDAEGRVNLAPALHAALVVDAPFAPLHDEDCAGLCAQCGTDLNCDTCDCHEVPDDSHPFARLKELLVDADAEDHASG